MVDTVGQISLRKENVDSIVKGFALQSYKMKQVVAISSSSANLETYYQEGSTELTGGTGSNIKGVPRLADFPYGEPNYTKATAIQEKYAFQGVVSWEDALLDNIDIISRTLLRIGRAVASAIDTQIYSALSTGAGNTVTITAGNEWNSATVANRDPVQDILNARRDIDIDNYDIDENGYLLVNPTDYAACVGNSKFINSPTFKSADVVTNGKVARICGLQVIKSNSVTADQALVVKGQDAATWKEAKALTTATILDEGIKYTIRAWEMGVLQVVNPNAICKIANTAA